jgi:hypothetical protein
LVEIRDETIAELDRYLDGTYRDEQGERWAALDRMPVRDAIRVAIADAVDATLMTLLARIDNAEFDIRWRADAASEFVDPTEGGFGECLGWYAGQSGWLENFATQRTYP